MTKKRAVEPRPTQTKVKHIILEKYLKAWGGIIVNGLRGQGKDIHFIYIDCNASFGRYNGELEDSVVRRETQTIWGSPIIGVKALDDHVASITKDVGINIRTNSILIEVESNPYNELKRSLEMAGLGHRVRETDNFSALKDGEIALLQADSTTMASKLTRYTRSGYKFSFFTLDPYGPTGIPLNFVHEIIRWPRHDVIIYMPYLDLHKKSGLVPRLSRSSTDERLLQNYNEMFGNEEWQSIVRELDSSDMRRGQESLAVAPQTAEAIKAGRLELDLMNAYKRSLLSIDRPPTVKSIGLHFPDKNRTMYYLYLTTHDPTGALTMNDVLSEAGYQEHELRWNLMLAKKQPVGQLILIDVPAPAPPLQTPPRATSEEIEKHILDLLGGRTLTKRDIYSAFADETYFAGEIDKALRNLRKQKKASFEGKLQNKTLIKLERN
jgi:three-Cys-motif partner protein